MKRRIRRCYRRFKRYMDETLANKILALILVFIGVIPIWIIEDGTFLVLMLIFAVPLFFAKENEIGKGAGF